MLKLKFFNLTPISLKIYMEQVHRSVDKMSKTDFWIFVFSTFWRPFKVEKLAILQKSSKKEH